VRAPTHNRLEKSPTGLTQGNAHHSVMGVGHSDQRKHPAKTAGVAVIKRQRLDQPIGASVAEKRVAATTA
jgi:hypothetical protein